MLSRFHPVATLFVMTRVQVSIEIHVHEASKIRVQHLVFGVHLILSEKIIRLHLPCSADQCFSYDQVFRSVDDSDTPIFS